MTTINGHTLGERVDTMLGELRAGHDMRSIVEHHLGVCYTEIETLRTACWESVGFCVHARQAWPDWEDHPDVGMLFAKMTEVLKEKE